MLREKIGSDVKTAMRLMDKKLLSILRLIMSAIKQVEIDERITVDDSRVISILSKLAKQRKESITQYTAANRQDLIDVEAYELEIIQSYLPESLPKEEIEKIINQAIVDLNAVSISELGKVMNAVKPKLQGKCDLSQVSSIIKAILQN